MTGIYKITNLINGKSYIGQSINIEKRFISHKQRAFNKKDRDYNKHLYCSIRKYGLNNFSFEILEECSIDELNDRERYYIIKYNSFLNGYNLTLGGDSSRAKSSKQQIAGIVKDLKTTILSHKDIANKWNVSIEMVQGINTGRYWHLDNEKYPLQNRNAQWARRKNLTLDGYIDKKENFCLDCGKKISKNSLRCCSCEGNRRKKENILPVIRDELKDLIRTIPFTTIGKQFNVSDNAVRKWCDKYHLPRTKKEINSYSDEEWKLI